MYAALEVTFMLFRKAYKGTFKTNTMQRMMKPFYIRKKSPHQSLFPMKT